QKSRSKPTHSSNKELNSRNKLINSSDRFTHSRNKLINSSDRFTHSRNKLINSSDSATHSRNKLTNSSDRFTHSSDKSTNKPPSSNNGKTASLIPSNMIFPPERKSSFFCLISTIYLLGRLWYNSVSIRVDF